MAHRSPRPKLHGTSSAAFRDWYNRLDEHEHHGKSLRDLRHEHPGEYRKLLRTYRGTLLKATGAMMPKKEYELPPHLKGNVVAASLRENVGTPITKALQSQRKRQRAFRNMNPELRKALKRKGITIHEDGSIGVGGLTVDAETGKLRPPRKMRQRLVMHEEREPQKSFGMIETKKRRRR